MDFFDNFKIKKNKDKVSILYGKKTLAVVSPKVILSIISDHAPKQFLSDLLEGVDLKPIDDALIKKAIQFEKAYTNRRKKYHRNKNLKSIDRKTKEFQNFVKAVEIIKRHNTNYKIFIDAQLEGLSFVNDGKGTFPKPAQLITTSAEDRLIQYIYDDEAETSSENLTRKELSYSDKNTSLNENPSYQARYKKMKSKKANLQDAYFVHDCQIARKGYVTDFVTDYIEELS